MSFFQELKRRNVFRVGIAYVIVAWLTLQVTDIVVPILELPDVLGKGVLFLLAIGLPIAVIFAWAFELTPEGVKKEKDVSRSSSNTHHTGRKLDLVIIGVLTAAVAIFALDKFVWTADSAPETTANAAQQTIAVLPFLNMSSDEEQEYFSDGLTEELLNLLTRIPQLRVTSRSSAFYYKGKEIRIAEVGRELGVDHILEGSVRRSGETIRITAQLINVADDSHIWSNTWDRKFDDIFVIQDEIAQAVVDELRVRLVGDTPRSNATDPQAYAMYLRAKLLLKNRTAGNLQRAERMLNAALEIDSKFVDAWIGLGEASWASFALGMRGGEEAALVVREAANRALALDPKNAGAHSLLATVAQGVELDVATASREIQIALSYSPNDVSVLVSATLLASRTGRFSEAFDILERIKLIDPLRVESAVAFGITNLVARRYADSEDAWRRSLELHPDGVGAHQRLATILLLQGDHEGALAEAEKVTVEGRRRSVRAQIFQTIGDDEQAIVEHEKLIELGERWTYEIAQIYAFRGMADEAFDWFDRAIARSDSALWWFVGDPFLDGIRDDPRFAMIEQRLGIERE